MAEIFNYIENQDDSQFTLKELSDVLLWYVPDDKTIIRLQQKRYGSERLIDVLYSLRFAASYGKTAQYEISTTYHLEPRILSSESGNHLEHQEWDWILKNEFLEPITTILPPTPDELLKATAEWL
ncbi:hypothetical protein TNCV_2476051 [Trichonephila clavipes]|nr:hypothetical protein TNCV_2476051 [Trichonephila clavipes]